MNYMSLSALDQTDLGRVFDLLRDEVNKMEFFDRKSQLLQLVKTAKEVAAR